MSNPDPEQKAQANLLDNQLEHEGSVAESEDEGFSIFPAGGYRFIIFAISSTSIGAGILGLPDAYRTTGYVMSTIYLILITAQTVYSMHVLVSVADRTGLHSYEQMSQGLLHRNSLYAICIFRIIYALGAQVSYVVTVGNIVKPIFEDAHTDKYWHDGNGTKIVQALLWLVFLLPQCIPRELNSLRYVSAAGVLFMLYFFICVCINYGKNTDYRDSDLKAVATGNDAVQGIGVFIFSYMCQVNSVEVYYEMKNRTPNRFTLCSIISLTVCGCLYVAVGIIGYLNFGDELDGSILLLYKPVTDPYLMVCFVGVFIKICASYGLLNNAGCASSYHGLGWDIKKVTFMQHLYVSIPTAFVSAILGIFIPNVNTVFGFTGGVCGGFLAFVLPSLYYMYTGNWHPSTVGWGNYIATYLSLLAGVVAIVFGCGSTIYGAF